MVTQVAWALPQRKPVKSAPGWIWVALSECISGEIRGNDPLRLKRTLLSMKLSLKRRRGSAMNGLNRVPHARPVALPAHTKAASSERLSERTARRSLRKKAEEDCVVLDGQAHPVRAPTDLPTTCSLLASGAVRAPRLRQPVASRCFRQRRTPNGSHYAIRGFSRMRSPLPDSGARRLSLPPS